jgi:hypothetical protein
LTKRQIAAVARELLILFVFFSLPSELFAAPTINNLQSRLSKSELSIFSLAILCIYQGKIKEEFSLGVLAVRFLRLQKVDN